MKNKVRWTSFGVRLFLTDIKEPTNIISTRIELILVLGLDIICLKTVFTYLAKSCLPCTSQTPRATHCLPQWIPTMRNLTQSLTHQVLTHKHIC